MYLAEGVWKGYIKDYDGGTLMLCKFDHDIDYCNIQNKIGEEIELLQANINTISPHLIPHTLDVEAIAAHDIIPTNLIPGLAEIGYHSGDEEQEDSNEKNAKTECFNYIVEYMLKNNASWPFKDPVKIDVAPDYYTTITNPIDLSTMQKRVLDGYYDTIDKFTTEVQLMFDNARTYNRKDTVYYKMADKLE
jgi:histone acetyltransferase